MKQSFLLDLTIILTAAAFSAGIMQRFRMAVVPAYLLCGAAIGPHLLGFVKSPESLDAISHLALILLLFGIGLQLHISVLKHNLARMVAIGAGACILTTLGLWPLAMMFGMPAPGALIVAMGFSLSSTAVVLRLLAERREMKRMSSRLALAILVVQDLLVIGMLASIPIIARWAGTGPEASTKVASVAPQWVEVLEQAIISVAVVGGVILAERLVLPRILRFIARQSPELLTITAVAFAMCAALATYQAGFSLELGAFLAGLMLSNTLFRHQISGAVGPLRDVFIAVFFTTLGMSVDFEVLASSWWIVLVGTALLIGVKATAIGGTAWVLGATAKVALATGLSLAQAGEFSVILFDSAAKLGVLDEEVVAITVSIVVLSLILTSSLLGLGRWAGERASQVGPAPWFTKAALAEAPAKTEALPDGISRAVVAGYGPVGQTIVRALINSRIHCTVIELNPDTVATPQEGITMIYGDSSNVDVLEHADISHADAFVLTIPDEEAVKQACMAARKLAPELFIAVRMNTMRAARQAEELGADLVIVEEAIAAAAMQREVIDYLSRVSQEKYGKATQFGR